MRWSLFSGLAFALTTAPAHADNWRAQMISKFQVDNRETHTAQALLELWASFEFESLEYNYRVSASGAARKNDLLTRHLDHNSEVHMYRLFVEKEFKPLGLTFKGGRFQRADSLGFYTLDGVDIKLNSPSQDASVGIYAGVPSRIDDIRSTSGDYVLGWEAWVHWSPEWNRLTYFPLTIDSFDLRASIQRLNENHDYDDRMTLGLNTSGQMLSDWVDKYETSLFGTYRIDNNTLEDIGFTAQIDFNKFWRWRNSYEYFQPREPHPSFRETFTTRFALGEQSLMKTSLHYEPNLKWGYFIGIKRATRARGDDGYGMQAGINSRYLTGYRLSAEFDYLSLINDEAKSLYFDISHSPSSHLYLNLNTAWKLENKQLYGENTVLGAELSGRYRFNNHMFLSVSTRFIWNSRLNDEYLGTIEFSYFFDNHKPKFKPR